MRNSASSLTAFTFNLTDLLSNVSINFINAKLHAPLWYCRTFITFTNFAKETQSQMEIIFASNNLNKIREINNLFGNSFTLLSLADINMNEEIPENEITLEGNATHKARHIYKAAGMNVFADDTGLEVEALDGRPGVHSARFAGENKDSDSNIEKLLSLLENKTNRNARFRTVIALIFDGKEYLFEGIVEGTIIKEKRGKQGFGYDPVFIPEGKSVTFAEMDLDEKNRISHRARAFEKLKHFLCRHQQAENRDAV
jgi:XTP/dITP diphosphohydrolase